MGWNYGLRRLDYSTGNLEFRISDCEFRTQRAFKFAIRNLAISQFFWHHCAVPITCRKMHAGDVPEAFHMLTNFLSEDEHYLASSQAYGDSGLKGLNDALDLFLERPELGFVWLAYDENGGAGICVVCYAISTSMGTVVAKLDDVSVKADRRSHGVGSEMLEQLKEQLRKESVTRIDVAVHLENPQARRFYEKLGFVALNEERLSCLI